MAQADLGGRLEQVAVEDGRYRVGSGEWIAIPDWRPSDEVSAAVADLDGDGRPELLVMSGGAHTVGWGLDSGGRAADGWGPWTEVPGWPGGRVALTGPRELAAVADGAVTTVPLELDADRAADDGVWRILDFDSQILAVHAALLHTGDVLFFSGSGADPDDHDAHRYRTRVWHYPRARFSAPRTPIDLFCAGQAFLPGGRLLAAGGTSRYHPSFRGLRDALTFNPGTRKWARVRKMLRPRWYPTLLTLGDGRVISVSGRGADGELDRVPEVYEAGARLEQPALARAAAVVRASVPARRRPRLLLGRADERQSRRPPAGLAARERAAADRAADCPRATCATSRPASCSGRRRTSA